MKQYRIYFCDFWNGFNPELHNLGPIIKHVFPNSIILDEPIDVDICVYSCFGIKHKDIDAKYMISYQGETGNTTFGPADLAIGFTQNNHKEFRFPLWHFNLHENTKYDESKLFKYLEPRKSKWNDFTSYNIQHPISAVYSNNSGLRYTTMPILINNHLCASYGRLYRTHIPEIDNKDIIVQKHPFHISFENTKKEGYVTEKLRDALLNDSLPFYWGCSKWAKEDFNPNAFFDISNFDVNDGLKACHTMVDVMNNKQYCESMRKEPIFKNFPSIKPLYDVIKNVVHGYDV